MSRVIRWQLQHGFHDKWSFYLGCGQAQRGAMNTCWVLGYAIMIVHNYK
jgi:hypothetical protein